MATFTTPTTTESSDDILFGRYQMPVGVSVLWDGSAFVERPYPWMGEIADLTEGVTWFQGGRTYEIDCATAAQLRNDGFDPDDSECHLTIGYNLSPDDETVANEETVSGTQMLRVVWSQTGWDVSATKDGTLTQATVRVADAPVGYAPIRIVVGRMSGNTFTVTGVSNKSLVSQGDEPGGTSTWTTSFNKAVSKGDLIGIWGHSPVDSEVELGVVVDPTISATYREVAASETPTVDATYALGPETSVNGLLFVNGLAAGD